MNYIKPMTRNEFADYLLGLKIGETVDFAIDPGVKWPDEIPDVTDVSGWYFVRVMKIPEYASAFILIDYAGGGSAFVIPLDDCEDIGNDNDKELVPLFVDDLFNKLFLENNDDVIFVEIKEGIRA